MNKSSPVQIGALTTWASVSAGGDRSYAIKTDNTIWSWRDGSYDALGLSSTADKSSPVQIGALTWNKVSAGESFTIATK